MLLVSAAASATTTTACSISLKDCCITSAGNKASATTNVHLVDLLTVAPEDGGLTVACATTEGDNDETMARMYFSYGNANLTHTEYRAPYYGAGNDGDDWLFPVPYLSECGFAKTLTVSGDLWDGTPCFSETYEFNVVCDTWPNENSTILYNGGFERKNSGWVENIEPVKESSDSFTGNGAIKLEAGGLVTQTVRIAPNSMYTLSANLKLEALDPGYSAGVMVGGTNYTLAFPSETDSYEYFNVSFDSGPHEEATVFVTGGDVRGDDFLLDGPLREDYTDVEAVFDWDIWTLEDSLPFTGDAGEWVFDALRDFVVTPNGNGVRHENKVDEDFRFALQVQYEEFSADITPVLSPFAETIVVQWHPVGLSILLAVFLTDMSSDSPILYNTETGEQWLELENGIAGDGIFDIVVINRAPGANELLLNGQNATESFGSFFQQEGFTVGTIKSEETFSIRSINDHGVFDVKFVVGGETLDFSLQADESADSYLKYGSYLQAKDPFTAERALSDADKAILTEEGKGQVFQDYYDSYGITNGTVKFKNVHYIRSIDAEALEAAAAAAAAGGDE